MTRTRFYISLIISAIFTVANAEVYIVGGFNNWDISHPTLLQQEANLNSAIIDFSSNQSFKISTSCPEGGDTSAKWAAFDTGTFVFSDNPQIGEWTGIEMQPKSGNLHAPASEKLKITVDLNAMRMMFSRPDISDSYSHTLPVLFIDTEGGKPVTSKEEYLQASYWLDPMDCEGIEAIGSKDSPLTMQIKGRGNYSWVGFDKKPYRLKLDKKQPLLGMTASKHWALLAHADDDLGMLRNVTGFAASRLLGMPWTPGDRPCEVVLNGDYIGLYFLTETIRVDKSRVDITEQADYATTDVDGGWLVEIDNYDSDPHVTVNENGNSHDPIRFTYKSPEFLSSEQTHYLTASMTDIDNAIYRSGEDVSPLERLVDLDVLARYYIVQELLDDTESFHGSCYLYRDRGDDCKWKIGPVWDFGNAYHRGDYRQFVWQNPAFRQVWIGGIYKFPRFVAEVKRVWADFLNDGPERLNEAVTEMAERIDIAADYDYARWPKYGTDRELSKCSEILTKLNDKIAWLKTQWGATPSGIHSVSSDDTDTPTEYYNLQGIRIPSPIPGQLTIQRKGTSTVKVTINKNCKDH